MPSSPALSLTQFSNTTPLILTVFQLHRFSCCSLKSLGTLLLENLCIGHRSLCLECSSLISSSPSRIYTKVIFSVKSALTSEFKPAPCITNSKSEHLALFFFPFFYGPLFLLICNLLIYVYCLLLVFPKLQSKLQRAGILVLFTHLSSQEARTVLITNNKYLSNNWHKRRSTD